MGWFAKERRAGSAVFAHKWREADAEIDPIEVKAHQGVCRLQSETLSFGGARCDHSVLQTKMYGDAPSFDA